MTSTRNRTGQAGEKSGNVRKGGRAERPRRRPDAHRKLSTVAKHDLRLVEEELARLRK